MPQKQQTNAGAVDLFGNPRLTPRQLLQEQLSALLQETATRTAGADPRTQGVSMMGAAAGGLLRNVLIDKGVLPKPPEVERAERMQAIGEQVRAETQEQGLDPEKDWGPIADKTIGHLLRANLPEEAWGVLQMKQLREANMRAADLERVNIEYKQAQIDELKKGNSGHGEFLQPFEALGGLVQVDARRPGVAYEAGTGRRITQPIHTVKYDPQRQAQLSAGKAGGAAASKMHADLIDASSKIEEQKTLAQEALQQFHTYSQSSMAGTGPFATGFGLTQYVSEQTQALEAKFRQINLKNMAATFEGMSRAIDTQAERRAWERTQPGVALDDAVNYQILVGSISMAAKAEAEANARKQYIENSPDGTLKGYKSPIFGQTQTLFSPDGSVQVVPKDQSAQLTKRGWMGADKFVTHAMNAPAKTEKPAAGKRRYNPQTRTLE